MLPPHHFDTPVSDLVQLGNSQTVQPTRAYTQTRWKISVSCWEVYSWTANFPIYWRHSFKSVSIGLSNLHRTFWRRQSRAIFSRYRHLQPTTSILTRTSHPHRFFFQILSIVYLHHHSLTFQRLQGDGGSGRISRLFQYCSMPTRLYRWCRQKTYREKASIHVLIGLTEMATVLC